MISKRFQSQSQTKKNNQKSQPDTKSESGSEAVVQSKSDNHNKDSSAKMLIKANDESSKYANGSSTPVPAHQLKIQPQDTNLIDSKQIHFNFAATPYNLITSNANLTNLSVTDVFSKRNLVLNNDSQQTKNTVTSPNRNTKQFFLKNDSATDSYDSKSQTVAMVKKNDMNSQQKQIEKQIQSLRIMMRSMPPQSQSDSEKSKNTKLKDQKLSVVIVSSAANSNKRSTSNLTVNNAQSRVNSSNSAEQSNHNQKSDPTKRLRLSDKKPRVSPSYMKTIITKQKGQTQPQSQANPKQQQFQQSEMTNSSKQQLVDQIVDSVKKLSRTVSNNNVTTWFSAQQYDGDQSSSKAHDDHTQNSDLLKTKTIYHTKHKKKYRNRIKKSESESILKPVSLTSESPESVESDSDFELLNRTQAALKKLRTESQRQSKKDKLLEALLLEKIGKLRGKYKWKQLLLKSKTKSGQYDLYDDYDNGSDTESESDSESRLVDVKRTSAETTTSKNRMSKFKWKIIKSKHNANVNDNFKALLSKKDMLDSFDINSFSDHYPEQKYISKLVDKILGS